MRNRWTATLLLALALVMGGCAPGDDDGGGAPAEPTQPQQADEPAGNPDDGY